jgi:hypothetical protein
LIELPLLTRRQANVWRNEWQLREMPALRRARPIVRLTASTPMGLSCGANRRTNSDGYVVAAFKGLVLERLRPAQCRTRTNFGFGGTISRACSITH